jgi:protein MpaA
VSSTLLGFAAVAVALAMVLEAGTPPAAGVLEDKRSRRLERRVAIGRSVEGRTITAGNIGSRAAPTKVLVVGCIHGNECAGKAVLRALRDGRRPRGYELWLIGALNPDGARAGTRQNARGVDLNRNFGAGWRPIGQPWDSYHSGRRPWSEPETRAARGFIRRLRPDITIWYHQALALVTRMKRHVRVQRRYARLVDLPLTRLDPLPGTAPRWQNRRFPGRTAFVVELRAGALDSGAASMHAGAVRRVARMWRFRTQRHRVSDLLAGRPTTDEERR